MYLKKKLLPRKILFYYMLLLYKCCLLECRMCSNPSLACLALDVKLTDCMDCNLFFFCLICSCVSQCIYLLEYPLYLDRDSIHLRIVSCNVLWLLIIFCVSCRSVINVLFRTGMGLYLQNSRITVFI